MRTWLKDLRISQDVTQENLAKETEVSRAYITQIELGNRDPSVKTAKKIAEVLDFDWTKFYE